MNSLNEQVAEQHDVVDIDTSTNTTITTDISEIAREQIKMKLLEKYSSGKKTSMYDKKVLSTISRVVREELLPVMKFIESKKSYASFEQPDFSDPHHYIHRVFNKLGAMKNTSVLKKADIWMTYRSDIRLVFGLHRSNLTTQMKKVFVKGKNMLL